VRAIVEYPDPILRTVTPTIEKVDERLLKEIADLTEVLKASENTAAGLAATQIGFKSRFFGLKNAKGKLEIFINPEITVTYGNKIYPVMIFEDGKKEDFLEGCLSFPDLFGTVKRFLKIEIERDEIKNGKLVKKKEMLEGFEAIVFQHEAEHLDGVLFVDHIKEDGGKLYKFDGEKRKVVNVKDIL
jgi:peptide deformylase